MCSEAIADPATTLRCTAERAFLRGLGGGCSLPIGVQSTLTTTKAGDVASLALRGCVLSFDGAELLEAELAVPVRDVAAAGALGMALCDDLKARGAAALLETLRAAAAQK